jgi:hypothetical protein
MIPEQGESLLAEFGLGSRRPPELFRSADEVGAASLNGYTPILRRAWQNFDGLFGVLAVDGRPTVFLQHRQEQGRISVRDQRRFWSNGVAPILVRVTPREIQVYSGLRSPALNDQDVDADQRLIDAFEGASKALELRDFLRSVEAGTVYGRYPKSFDPAHAVDRRLVESLRAARVRMTAGRNAPDLVTIHRLLGGVLFTCYLEARRVLVDKDFGRLGAGRQSTFRNVLDLAEPQSVRMALTRLFRRLGRYFRGNLFDDKFVSSVGQLRDEDVATLRNLASGHDLGAGQMVLPFYVYDFSVIPIETISAVYEDFVRAEDPKEQRRKGAYYTPPKLVEFTIDLATEGDFDVSEKRALDPGCGSGAFLVSVFNRMGEAWVRSNGRARNGTRAQALAKILRERICGVDTSLIACQATCLSLYMAMLDFLEPREIRGLGPERLPPLLLEGSEKRRHNGPQTVVHGDFLSALPALESQTFDLIVGNPPWVARGNVEKKVLQSWRKTNRGLPTPAGQLACAFMWEVPQYLKRNGRACLLLPANVLLGDQTDGFQKKWFTENRVEKVAQLSDLRFFLFPNAAHPTVAIRFSRGESSSEQMIDYLTPKANYASLFDNVIAVETDDRKTVALTDFLSYAAHDEAAVFWLSYNWPSPRDREFLSRLRALPPLSDLAGDPEENKRWIKGQGFQPKSKNETLKNPKSPFWEPGHPFLPTKRKFDLILSTEDIVEVDPDIAQLRRSGADERLFKSPLIVFNKGFSKVAFSPFDVVFRHAVQAISGSERDRDILMLLTATLLSPLAQYFVFHLTSKPIYRGNPLLKEVMRIPFPLPEHAPGRDPFDIVRAITRIIDRVRADARFGGLGHQEAVKEARSELSKLVYTYFDVSPDEEILIADTVETLRRSATPSAGSAIRTLAESNAHQRRQYAATLSGALRAWTGNSAPNVDVQCVVSQTSKVAVLTIAKASAPTRYEETNASDAFNQVLSRLKQLSPDRYGSLVYLRNLAVLDNDRIHVTKPLALRFWLRSAALNDADVMATRLLTRRFERVQA